MNKKDIAKKYVINWYETHSKLLTWVLVQVHS